MPVDTHDDIVPATGVESSNAVETHNDVRLAHGVERAEGRHERAYGGSIPGPKLDMKEPEQFGRRLVEWAFAAAPIVSRSHTPSFAGQWKYPNVHMRADGGRIEREEPHEDRAGKFYGGGMGGGFKGFSPGFKGSRSRFTTSNIPQGQNEINVQGQPDEISAPGFPDASPYPRAQQTPSVLLRPPVLPAAQQGSIPRLPNYVQGFGGGYPSPSPQQPMPTGQMSGYPTGGFFDVFGPMLGMGLGSFFSGMGGMYGRGFADGGSVDDEPRSLTPMGFYSAAAEAASTIPQRAPIDQILNKIKGSPNVKAEELDWSGVRDAFAGQKSVDPKEVARHFQENLPQLQETVKYDPTALAEMMHRDRQSLLVQGKTDEAAALKDKISETYNPSWRKENAARYDDYTIPDGENYREVLLHLPVKQDKPYDPVVSQSGEKEYPWIVSFEKDGKPVTQRYRNEDIAREMADFIKNTPVKADVSYQSSHWNVPNVVAHLRMSDRRGDMGEKILHVEEMQSDWGQEKRDNKEVPDGPHVGSTESWTDLALKRALREAAEGGYKKLVWTPGKDQAERYDLSNQVKHVMWSPDNKILSALTHDGSEAVGQKVEKDELEKYLGKEVASRLLEQEPEMSGNMATHHLRGQDLSIGGEGMRGYYDRLVPQRLKKLVSKLDPDAKFGKFNISYEDDGDEKNYDLHSLEITPRMRAAILKGLPAYEKGGSVIDGALDVISKYSR